MMAAEYVKDFMEELDLSLKIPFQLILVEKYRVHLDYDDIRLNLLTYFDENLRAKKENVLPSFMFETFVIEHLLSLMHYARKNVATTMYLRQWVSEDDEKSYISTKEDIDNHFKKVSLIMCWLVESARAHDKARFPGDNPFPEMALNVLKVLIIESNTLINLMHEDYRKTCIKKSNELIENAFWYLMDCFDSLEYTTNPFYYIALDELIDCEGVEIVLFGKEAFDFPSEDNNISETDEENYSTSDNTEASLSEWLAELNDLIGLGNVKTEVNTLINMLKLNKVRAERGMKQVPTSKHLVFSGNPGTGKTTVARILAKIYKALGVLSKGQLIEVDRSKLVAGYVGQTAIQTQEVIQQALGGILFIDEAYTLSRSDSGNDFGQEAIDTILKAMEDNRDDFVVIVAGYPDLMQDFLNSNPGLRSRFNKFINFEDYTPDELTAIFNLLCKKSGYDISDEIDAYLHDYFEERYNNRDRNFANGREVRNFFEIAVANQANRLATDHDLTDEELVTLTIEDIKW